MWSLKEIFKHGFSLGAGIVAGGALILLLISIIQTAIWGIVQLILMVFS